MVRNKYPDGSRRYWPENPDPCANVGPVCHVDKSTGAMVYCQRHDPETPNAQLFEDARRPEDRRPEPLHCCQECEEPIIEGQRLIPSIRNGRNGWTHAHCA